MFKGSIKDLFDKIDSFEWSRGVCIEEGEVTLQTLCIVVDDNMEEVVYDGVNDKIVLEKDYIELLGVSDIRSIFSNLEQQIKNPSDDLKLKPLIFYFETDCFLEIDPET